MAQYLCPRCGGHVEGKKNRRDIVIRLIIPAALLYTLILLLTPSLFTSIYGIVLIPVLFLLLLVFAYMSTPERCPSCSTKLGKRHFASMAREETLTRLEPVSKVSGNKDEEGGEGWLECPHCATPNPPGVKNCGKCRNSMTVKAPGQPASDANIRDYINRKEKHLHNSVVAGGGRPINYDELKLLVFTTRDRLREELGREPTISEVDIRFNSYLERKKSRAGLTISDL